MTGFQTVAYEGHVSIVWQGESIADKGTVSADLVVSEWWLNRAIVQPESNRRKGIGGKMLEMLKEEVKKLGGDAVMVTPGGYDLKTKDQYNFYEKHGFVKHLEGCLVCQLKNV